MDELKNMLAKLDQQTTNIINAGFGVVFFVLFILSPLGFGVKVSNLFDGTFGQVLVLLATIILTLVAIGYPFIKNKLCSCVNYTLGVVTLTVTLLICSWGVITILWFILIFIPWMAFTFLKK